MNLARILVLVIALGAGGAAAYLAMNMINQEPATIATTVAQVVEPAAPAIETEEVLVAVRDIRLEPR